MTAEVSASDQFSAARPIGLSRRRLGIGFLNWAHALDHFVILIYPTVVIKLQLTYGRSYSELIALSTASFIAFGLVLAAGGLACRPLEPPQHDGRVLTSAAGCRSSPRRSRRR